MRLEFRSGGEPRLLTQRLLLDQRRVAAIARQNLHPCQRPYAWLRARRTPVGQSIVSKDFVEAFDRASIGTLEKMAALVADR